MKKKAVITAISMSLLLPFAAAELQLDRESLSEYKQVANQNSNQLPKFVKDLVGDQDINVYIQNNESEQYNISLQMNGTEVDTIANQSLQAPDIEVWTSEKIIQNISESEQPVDQMKNAINRNDIKYQANDTWTEIKLFFAETFMSIL